MSEIADRYRRLSDAFAVTIAGVPDDRWSSPSPCEAWDARQVVGHVVAIQGMFIGFIGEEMGEIPAVDDDPAAAWDAARARSSPRSTTPTEPTPSSTASSGARRWPPRSIGSWPPTW